MNQERKNSSSSATTKEPKARPKTIRIDRMPSEADQRLSVIYEKYGKNVVEAFINEWERVSDERRKDAFARQLVYNPHDKRVAFSPDFRQWVEKRFGCEFYSLFTEKANKLRNAKLPNKGRTHGVKSTVSAKNMPADPLMRATNLVALYPTKVDEFVKLAKALPFSDKVRATHRKQYIYGPLYAPYDKRSMYIPAMVKDLICLHFGLESFEDCLTERRKEFLSSPKQSLRWDSTKISKVKKIGEIIASLREEGISVFFRQDQASFEMPGVEPITLAPDGSHRYIPRLNESDGTVEGAVAI